MTSDEMRDVIAKLDASSSADAEVAWSQLREFGVAVVPHLAAAYPTFRSWLGRTRLVYYAVRHARVSEDALHLGCIAVRDRSFMVRYRACGLLAYSLRRDALAVLMELRSHPDQRTREDVAAAITAIEHQNHHLFVDRTHSGRARWTVNDDD